MWSPKAEALPAQLRVVEMIQESKGLCGSVSGILAKRAQA